METAIALSKENTYIDLFAGCGGLSLGLEVSGFNLGLAVEKSPMAAETFHHNFISPDGTPDTWTEFKSLPLAQQVASRLVVRELKTVLNNRKTMTGLKNSEIALVTGGPPCQGFSMAGLRNPGDQRNQLPYEFLEFVKRTQPKTVLMENVVGINRDFNKAGSVAAPFFAFAEALSIGSRGKPGYVVQKLLLNAQDYGVPQHRPRMLLLGVRKDLVANRGDVATDGIWRSDESNMLDPKLAPSPPVEFLTSRRTAEEALADLSGPGYTSKSTPNEYIELMKDNSFWGLRGSDPTAAPNTQSLTNHVVRRHTDNTIKKFRLYHFLNILGIPREAIATHPENADIARIDHPDYSDLRDRCIAAYKKGKQQYKANGDPFPHWTDPQGNVLSRSAEQFLRELAGMHTRKHSQRVLNPDKPAPTILGSPDDHIHFAEPRVMTVREHARLQSFPDSFVFKAKETTGGLKRREEVPQYTQVGNAVPPLLGKAVGDHIMSLLKEIEAHGQLQ